jgi:hypothetical protein
MAPKKSATVLAGGGGSCLISAPGFRPKLLFFVQLRTDVLKHKPTKVALDPDSKKPRQSREDQNAQDVLRTLAAAAPLATVASPLRPDTTVPSLHVSRCNCMSLGRRAVG